MTASQAAAYLHISLSHLYKLTSSKRTDVLSAQFKNNILQAQRLGCVRVQEKDLIKKEIDALANEIEEAVYSQSYQIC